MAVFLELLRPTLTQAFRAASPRTFTDLLTWATYAETDQIDISRLTIRKPEVKLAPQAKEPASKLPRCWYCPEHYFNRDCPVKKKAESEDQEKPRKINGLPGRSCSPDNRAPRLATTTSSRGRLSRILVKFAGHDIHSLYDTAASDNFLYLSYLLEDLRRKLRRSTAKVTLAIDGVEMKIVGEIDLD